VNKFIATTSVLGKYRRGAMSDDDLARAILRAIKDLDDGVRACGHKDTGAEACVICQTLESLETERDRDYGDSTS